MGARSARAELLRGCGAHLPADPCDTFAGGPAAKPIGDGHAGRTRREKGKSRCEPCRAVAAFESHTCLCSVASELKTEGNDHERHQICALRVKTRQLG
jgi:hypothetical protein